MDYRSMTMQKLISLVPYNNRQHNSAGIHRNTNNTSNASSSVISRPRFIPGTGGFSQTMNYRQRYTPYNNDTRTSLNNTNSFENQFPSLKQSGLSSHMENRCVPRNTLTYSEAVKGNNCGISKVNLNGNGLRDCKDSVALQISNLDPGFEEHNIGQYLISKLKPITPVISLTMETPSVAKIKVPSMEFAKLVVAHLHRKKIGHKRIVVSYLRDPSSAETSALKCQVAGLLKDVPDYSLPVYQFRELFQSRFKTSINILELYRMSEVCSISIDKNDEKFITLHPDLLHSIKSNPLVEASQHSVPYCVYHFKQQQDKGWAEQEIEPLPNVLLSLTQVESILYNLLKKHKDDIPIASILHCIESELGQKIETNENGVPFEHLICCARGVQLSLNNFGIKVVTWLERDTSSSSSNCDASETSSVYAAPSSRYSGGKGNTDPLYSITREVIELLKMSPKATMKFNRFIPTYHNHFGKQCRVADYGSTKLIELFEAMPNTVQIMGDGEARQITLTHRTQIRRFTTELLKILRVHPTKSILLSQLPDIFTQTNNRTFDITDYGVCDINDMVEGLVNYNAIVIQPLHNGADLLISMMKRKQTITEMEKTCIFAGEVVELFRIAPQFTIPFKKFVRSYHYHFGYQCRLSDYGFLKLADLLEAIHGIVKMENCAVDDDRRIFLCQTFALRIFSEQLQEIIKYLTNKDTSMVKLNEILQLHKNKFGYQIQPQTLGYEKMCDAIKDVPYVEVLEKDGEDYIISHREDVEFRQRSYAAAIIVHETGSDKMVLKSFLAAFAHRFSEMLTEKMVFDMKHALKITLTNGVKMISLTPKMKFILSLASSLENQNYVNIYEIKTHMSLPFGFCFEYGYPNLSSLVQSHLDIFSSINESNIHERSEIRLRPDSIFTKTGLHDYIEHCRQVKASKMHRNSFSMDMPQPTGPYYHPQNNTTFMSDNQRYQGSNQFQNTHDWQNNTQDNNNNSRWPNAMSAAFKPMSNANQWSSDAGQQHIYERRNIGSDVASLGDLLNLHDTFGGFNFSSYYEPPKPDTPPTRVMPFNYDPVWSNGPNNDGFNTGCLNIHLPELKTLNIMPVISSPCGHISSNSSNNGLNNSNQATDKNNNNSNK